ncbi:hypothetical protein [Kribbella endophytica]
MSKESKFVGAGADRSDEREAPGSADPIQPNDVELTAAQSAMVTASIDSFRASVDRELEGKLEDDEVRVRLKQVHRRIDRWSADSADGGSINELAANGYGLIRLWLLLVVAVDATGLGLTVQDVDEVAQETVASAVNRVCDEPAVHDDWTTAFLLQCVASLPHAYRSWRLRAGTLESDELVDLLSDDIGTTLVERLRYAVTSPQAAGVLHGEVAAEDVDEVLTLTRRVLTLAAGPREADQR